MKTQGLGIGSVLLIDLAPDATALGDPGLEVVDPIDRGHAAEPAVGFVVDVVPGQLVDRPAPDHGFLATVAQHHDERIQRRRSLRVSEIDPAELAPIARALGPRRGLDPAKRPDGWPAEVSPHVLADRLVGAVIAVLGPEELVESLDIGGPVVAGGFGLGLPPVGDDFGQTELLDP